MSTCPHCTRAVAPNRLRSHTTVCVHNQEAVRHIRSTLRQLSHHGVILSRCDYVAKVAGRNGMPSANFLLREIGTWDVVAQWAGLKPYRQRAEVLWKATREALQELSYRLHDGEYGPSAEEWHLYQPGDLLTAPDLLLRFTTWSSVLGWGGGMQEADAEYYIRCRNRRETRRMVELTERKPAHRKLADIEQTLQRIAEEGIGLPIVSEPQERIYYDWSTRRYRQCVAASVR